MLHIQGRTQDFGAGGGDSGVAWVESVVVLENERRRCEKISRVPKIFEIVSP
jgi:hypothetical protein